MPHKYHYFNQQSLANVHIRNKRFKYWLNFHLYSARNCPFYDSKVRKPIIVMRKMFLKNWEKKENEMWILTTRPNFSTHHPVIYRQFIEGLLDLLSHSDRTKYFSTLQTWNFVSENCKVFEMLVSNTTSTNLSF